MNIDRLSQSLASGAYARRTGRSGDAAAATGASSADVPSSRSGAAAPRTDGVDLSESGRSLNRIRNAVLAAPDVRDELVSDLRQQIQSGAYKVSDEALARKIVDGS